MVVRHCVDVPFQLPYGSLICPYRLHRYRPKWRGLSVDPGTPRWAVEIRFFVPGLYCSYSLENSKLLYPTIAQDLLFQMRYGSLVCSKQWLCETQNCWGMFLRLEETTVLERQENRGCLSFLSATWLFLGVRWAIIPHLKEDVKGYVLI